MYRNKVSGLKLSIITILAITILCSVTFGTLAYFRFETTASGVITVGSDINFLICNSAGSTKTSTVTISNFSGNQTVDFNVKKTAGVNAKLRVYVSVSIVDENGYLQNMLNGSNAIVTVNMGTSSDYKWVSDSNASAQEKLVGAHWRYLKDSTGTTDYKIGNDEIISICPTITINSNPYAGMNYSIIVTLTAEMLQYDNASW